MPNETSSKANLLDGSDRSDVIGNMQDQIDTTRRRGRLGLAGLGLLAGGALVATNYDKLATGVLITADVLSHTDSIDTQAAEKRAEVEADYKEAMDRAVVTESVQYKQAELERVEALRGVQQQLERKIAGVENNMALEREAIHVEAASMRMVADAWSARLLTGDEIDADEDILAELLEGNNLSTGVNLQQGVNRVPYEWAQELYVVMDDWAAISSTTNEESRTMTVQVVIPEGLSMEAYLTSGEKPFAGKVAELEATVEHHKAAVLKAKADFDAYINKTEREELANMPDTDARVASAREWSVQAQQRINTIELDKRILAVKEARKATEVAAEAARLKALAQVYLWVLEARGNQGAVLDFLLPGWDSVAGVLDRNPELYGANDCFADKVEDPEYCERREAAILSSTLASTGGVLVEAQCENTFPVAGTPKIYSLDGEELSLINPSKAWTTTNLVGGLTVDGLTIKDLCERVVSGVYFAKLYAPEVVEEEEATE